MKGLWGTRGYHTIFKLFERQANLTLKQLVQETEKPAVRLLIFHILMCLARSSFTGMPHPLRLNFRALSCK
ncbi:hypothetical protein RHGRI_022060 [Rhododendron griersonianum]|uniref:Uncharacterized protein n=1 Tax=Rhododendron griersonianum TaxID=479676 RepID=A0AAV6JRL8_9ERIC|nr:hypothetical protein RHGRI_022060 [Rhododendron griersonianum]